MTAVERMSRVLETELRLRGKVTARRLARLSAVPTELAERFLAGHPAVEAVWMVPTPCGRTIGFEGRLPEAYRCPVCQGRHVPVLGHARLVGRLRGRDV
jgi:hypothetical protein